MTISIKAAVELVKEYASVDTADNLEVDLGLSVLSAIDILVALVEPVANGTHVIVPVAPNKEMLNAGETAIENAQDRDYSSDADGNRHEYTYFVDGLSGAALSIYRAMIAAMDK